MLLHYLTVSLRNVLRNKLASSISVFGLAIALGGSMLVYAYVRWEFGYNTGFPDKAHVYRMVRSTESNTGVSFNIRTSGPLGPAIQASHPEVVSVTRLLRRRIFVGTGEKGEASMFCAADPNVMAFCAIEIVRGSAESLHLPGTVALSESYARLLFGGTDVVGRQVEVEESFVGAYEVVAVFKDFDDHTTQWFAVLAFPDPPADDQQSRSGMAAYYSWNARGWLPIETFLQLRSDADVDALESGIQKLLGVHLPDVASYNAYHLQPFNRIFLHNLPDYGVPDLGGGYGISYGDAGRLRGAILIAVMLVFGLAAFLAERRLKEICVRKVLGAGPWSLVYLLMRDHISLVLVASIVAIPTAAWLSRRWLADYATRIDLTDWPFATASVICVVATFLAVALPANRAIRSDPARNLRQE